jgi:hypothetical protein
LKHLSLISDHLEKINVRVGMSGDQFKTAIKEQIDRNTERALDERIDEALRKQNRSMS